MLLFVKAGCSIIMVYVIEILNLMNFLSKIVLKLNLSVMENENS